jgi:malate dehydrogenase
MAEDAVIVTVTNPLDLMAYFVLKTTGFKPNKVLGMGVSLDAARFSNLISKELKISACEVEAVVIGSHGEGMLPLPRFTSVKGVALDEFIDEAKARELANNTIKRGAEIVSLLGTGSAYFAPSAAIASLVKAIAKDEKRTLAVSAYLNGQYGVSGVCIGVPCLIGRQGAEKIIELELNKEEKKLFLQSAERVKEQYKYLFAE